MHVILVHSYAKFTGIDDASASDALSPLSRSARGRGGRGGRAIVRSEVVQY